MTSTRTSTDLQMSTVSHHLHYDAEVWGRKTRWLAALEKPHWPSRGLERPASPTRGGYRPEGSRRRKRKDGSLRPFPTLPSNWWARRMPRPHWPGDCRGLPGSASIDPSLPYVPIRGDELPAHGGVSGLDPQRQQRPGFTKTGRQPAANAPGSRPRSRRIHDPLPKRMAMRCTPTSTTVGGGGGG